MNKNYKLLFKILKHQIIKILQLNLNLIKLEMNFNDKMKIFILKM